MQPARTCSHEDELEGLQSEVGRYPGGSRVPRGSCRNLNQKTRVANNEQVNELKELQAVGEPVSKRAGLRRGSLK